MEVLSFQCLQNKYRPTTENSLLTGAHPLPPGVNTHRSPEESDERGKRPPVSSWASAGPWWIIRGAADIHNPFITGVIMKSPCGCSESQIFHYSQLNCSVFRRFARIPTGQTCSRSHHITETSQSFLCKYYQYFIAANCKKYNVLITSNLWADAHVIVSLNH